MEIDWGAIITQALLMLVKAVLPLLLAALLGWLGLEWKKFRSGKHAELAMYLAEAARIAVASAEQSGLAKLIEDKAEVKKQFAIDYVENYLETVGLRVNVNLIADTIEAEVKKQFPHPEPVHSLPIDVGL